MSNNKPNKPQIPFPQRDIATANQIGNLIQVGSFAMNSILVHQQNGTEPQHRKEMDGGCKASAETLFIKVCSKLEDILDDADRWNFDIQNSLEGKLEQMYDQNLLFLAEQTKAAKNVNTPHFCYKPFLQRLPDGQWIAFIGDLEHVEDSIVGIGLTPKDALEAFDSLFTGDPMPDNLVAWLAERDAQEQQQKEQNESVDRRRNKKSGRIIPKRKDLPTDRGHTGPNPEVGGA